MLIFDCKRDDIVKKCVFSDQIYSLGDVNLIIWRVDLSMSEGH